MTSDRKPIVNVTDEELKDWAARAKPGSIAARLIAEIQMLRDDGWWATAAAAEGTIARLRKRVTAMRPVVEAARAWRPGRTRQGQGAAALCDAIDTYASMCEDDPEL